MSVSCVYTCVYLYTQQYHIYLPIQTAHKRVTDLYIYIFIIYIRISNIYSVNHDILYTRNSLEMDDNVCLIYPTSLFYLDGVLHSLLKIERMKKKTICFSLKPFTHVIQLYANIVFDVKV